MSLANPTQLRIGMRGEISGKNFRVIGRVVMGMEEDGEIYYWNEFNLKADDGLEATLVFEETERGGEWRLFTLFEPEYPISAADAASKRVGDRLNLDGTEIRVTLLGSSRVYRIEGQAPEGVEAGDVAKYFNARAGDLMQVVSWTGDEVECFHGLDLDSAELEAAFNLPRRSPPVTQGRLRESYASGNSDGGTSGISLKTILLLIGFTGLIAVVIGGNFSCGRIRESAPARVISAGQSPLSLGAKGKWNGADVVITAHAVLEIAQVGSIFERHEYQITDDTGRILLLVCGAQPGADKWMLFTPLAPLLPPSPPQCGAVKSGDIVNIDGVVVPVSELFQSTVRRVESVQDTAWREGAVTYGYSGRSHICGLLARWNASGAVFFRGTEVSAAEAKAAFAGKSGR